MVADLSDDCRDPCCEDNDRTDGVADLSVEDRAPPSSGRSTSPTQTMTSRVQSTTPRVRSSTPANESDDRTQVVADPSDEVR
jgi:hypothetical protein